MKKIAENIKDFILENPANFFVFAGILAIIIVRILDTYDAEFSIHDILVEAHGLIYDLFVFGVLLSLYEALRSKKEKIERLEDEIDDYRGWDEKEAMYRIVGNIKRLSRPEIGLHKLKLQNTYLLSAKLSRLNLSGTNLSHANLRYADLSHTDLSNTNLSHTDLSNTNLSHANLSNADLSHANLSNADLSHTDLSNTNLSHANLSNADLSHAKFSYDFLVGIKGMHFYVSIDNMSLTGYELFQSDLLEIKYYERHISGKKISGATIAITIWVQKLKEWNVMGLEDITSAYTFDTQKDCFILKRNEPNEY